MLRPPPFLALQHSTHNSVIRGILPLPLLRTLHGSHFTHSKSRSTYQKRASRICTHPVDPSDSTPCVLSPGPPSLATTNPSYPPGTLSPQGLCTCPFPSAWDALYLLQNSNVTLQKPSVTTLFKIAKSLPGPQHSQYPFPLSCFSISPIDILNIMHFCLALSLSIPSSPGMQIPLRAGILSVLFLPSLWPLARGLRRVDVL